MNRLSLLTRHFAAACIARTLCILCIAVSAAGCSRIDDTRLPAVSVNIVFTSQGMWERYGVNGALDTRSFIRTRTFTSPVDFPYTDATYTGFGGVLLVSNLYGMPIAYDLACPYEAKADIRIRVDKDALDAECPVCHSTYDIFGGEGRPTSGPAAERGYGLTRYRVLDGAAGAMAYRVISR